MTGRTINPFLTNSTDSRTRQNAGNRGYPMMSTFIKGLVDDQSGATAIEYGLIISLIVIAMIGALQGVASSTIAMWNDVESRSVAAMKK